MVRVHEVIRSTTCVRENVPAEQLASTFEELGISAAPVLDVAGKLLGVVTRTDLARESARSELEARELLTPIHFAIGEDQTLEEALALMAWKGVHRVPVTAAGTRAVYGLLNALDVVNWLLARKT
jgi:CBS domain-containing protein